MGWSTWNKLKCNFNELAEKHTERRKLFSGALMTSGSFSMMAAGAGMDRRRKLFHGALMTSGSFTMMAKGGGV